MKRSDKRGVSIGFIKAFFSYRSQFACYDAVLGAIQGSKTDTLFSNQHSGDVASMCSRDESILYADDTVHVYVGTSLKELTDHCNKILHVIF